MRDEKRPLQISLENLGIGYRVSLAELEGGWENIVRSAWYSDLCSARARALQWSNMNQDCLVREIGTHNEPSKGTAHRQTH